MDVLQTSQPATLDIGPLFIVGATVAMALLYLFCRKKFDERSVTGNSDYVYQLLPSELATRQEYNKGFLTYFGTIVFVVVALSLLGPKDLSLLGIRLDDVSVNFKPVYLAIVLMGIVPNIPVLQDIEKWLRQYAHEMAYIPRSALATAEKLTVAEFDFSGYTGEALQSNEIRGVDPSDFKQSRRTLEYAWARLCCLIYQQNSVLISGADSIETSLLRAYEKDLELIEKDKKSMEPEVALYRSERAKNPGYANKELETAIRNDLYKLYILLGCAVRLKKQPHNDPSVALERIGFRLGKAEAHRTNADLKLVAIALIAGCALVLEFIAVALAQFNLWPRSPVFPATFEKMQTDFVWALVPYVAAIMAADFIRERAIHNRSWFDAAGRTNAASYVRVVLVAGVAGFAALTAWGAIFAWPSILGLKSDAFYALIAATTGGFYVWYLDNVELGPRPLRWREIGYQAALTAISALIAATAAWSIVLGESPNSFVDKIVLVGAIGLAVGAVLGWYIPRAAAFARIDPLREAKKDRVHRLEMAAAERLGAVESGTWLDRPHAALGNRSPRETAGSVEGFEQALALLQTPQAVAA